ncbi:MAG TPA: hypothetical protein PKC48_06130 [Sphingorhabdus sp.]|uniref:hypothetical protein n=1 Tax=Sphingorhabdus sp. TaxID=1902408 RepID=UPI002B51F94F|nr:hypothetical protein [Sphingorhabdus sp.]HMU21846.1 hypothetical protein [Sphingorhabdus sp.]
MIGSNLHGKAWFRIAMRKFFRTEEQPLKRIDPMLRGQIMAFRHKICNMANYITHVGAFIALLRKQITICLE